MISLRMDKIFFIDFGPTVRSSVRRTWLVSQRTFMISVLTSSDSRIFCSSRHGAGRERKVGR